MLLWPFFLDVFQEVLGMNLALLLKNLAVEFPAPEGFIRAVDRVGLEIKERERVALVGETGSGKSVLLLALLRLLPVSACISGEVWYKGKNLLRSFNGELYCSIFFACSL